MGQRRPGLQYMFALLSAAMLLWPLEMLLLRLERVVWLHGVDRGLPRHWHCAHQSLEHAMAPIFGGVALAECQAAEILRCKFVYSWSQTWHGATGFMLWWQPTLLLAFRPDKPPGAQQLTTPSVDKTAPSEAF